MMQTCGAQQQSPLLLTVCSPLSGILSLPASLPRTVTLFSACPCSLFGILW